MQKIKSLPLFFQRHNVLACRVFHLVERMHQFPQLVLILHLHVLREKIIGGNALRRFHERHHRRDNGLVHQCRQLHHAGYENNPRYHNHNRHAYEHGHLFMIEAVAVLDRLIHQRRRVFLEIVLHLVDLIQALDIVRRIFPHRKHGVPLLAIDFITALDRPGLCVALLSNLRIAERKLFHHSSGSFYRNIQTFSLLAIALYVCLKLDTLFLERLCQFAHRCVIL